MAVLVAEHFAQYTTARTLHVALSERKPPIIVADGMLKIWFAKFSLPSDAVTVSSAEELHRRYGDLLPALAAQNPTAHRLRRVLKARTPPLYVSDAVLTQLLLRYFDAEPILQVERRLFLVWQLEADRFLARGGKALSRRSLSAV